MKEKLIIIIALCVGLIAFGAIIYKQNSWEDFKLAHDCKNFGVIKYSSSPNAPTRTKWKCDNGEFIYEAYSIKRADIDSNPHY